MMSNNKCILPWIAVDRNTKTKKGEITFSPCCLFETKKHYKSVEEYWNSEELQELRQSFIDNKKHSGCNQCWNPESKGIKSLRQSVNESRFKEYENRTFSKICTELPTQIKYTVGDHCNLACRMCVPNSSSKVKKVWETLEIEDRVPVDNFDWYNYIIQNYQSIKYLDITGGEPFYHKNTKKILRFLVESNKINDITIYITTNLTIIDEETINLLKKFKEVILRISIDSIGERQEYIRAGLNWKEFEKNIDRVKKENFTIMVAPSLSVLNICTFDQLETWCRQKNIAMSQPSIVEYPLEMAPHNLPVALHNMVPDKFKEILKQSINADSLNFIRKLDNFWNTDITSTMPEWKKVYDNLFWKNFDELQQINKELEKYVE